VMGSALSARYQNHLIGALASYRLPDAVLHTITGSLGGALGVATAVGGVTGALLAHAARAAFMSGVHLSTGFGALVAGAAALLVFVALPSRARPADEQASDRAGHAAPDARESGLGATRAGPPDAPPAG